MKRMLTLVVLVAAACNQGGAGSSSAPANSEPQTDDQKTLYALGQMIGRNVAPFQLTDNDMKYVERGMSDMIHHNKSLVEMDKFGPKIGELARSRAQAAAKVNRDAGKAYADKTAKEPGWVQLPDGVLYKQVSPGTGPSPAPTDRVKVHYTGKLIDGTVFDSSVQRGEPATFSLNGVIPCWTEGVAKMKVGEKAQLVCPADKAYGDRPQGQIPPGSTLVFDVELLSIEPPPPAGASPGGFALPPGHPMGGMPPGAHPMMMPTPRTPANAPANPPTKK